MARGLILTCAIGAVACGSILGLGDYEISGEPAAAPDGGVALADGGITLSASSLSFPEGKCGEKKTLPIVVANTTEAAVPLAVSAPSGITIEGTVPTVTAKGSVTLTIGTSGVDHGTVTLKLGAQSFDVPITAKFAGPRLALDTTTIDFGEIRHDLKSDPRPLDVENTGDADVRITGVAAGNDFTLDAPVTVPAHGKATASFTMTAAPAGDAITASGTIATDVPICDALPPLVFKGRRSPSDVTVSTTSLEVACVGGQQTPVKVTNYGSQPVTVNVTMKPPVNVTPGSLQLAPASPAAPSTGSCALYGIPPMGDYAYDLVITEGSLPPRTVTIGVHVFGAKLQYDTSKILLDAGTTASRPATNIGNVPICIHYSVENVGNPPSVVAEPDEEFDPNAAGDIQVTGVVVQGAPNHQHVRLRPQPVACTGATAASPLCAAMPELDVELGGN